jgi:hypothetical protein
MIREVKVLPVASCLLSAGRRPLRSALGLLCLVCAVGCAYLRPHLTPTELNGRLQYCHDSSLEELVGITLSQGQRAVNGGGQGRQILELNTAESATVHRQFFEVQPYGDGLSEVFFLENRGSVKQSNLNRFPRHSRKAIRDFLNGLPEGKKSKYKPLWIRQEKLSRRMIFYENDKGKKTFEFTRKVSSLEISNLYGLFHLPDGPFIFFGQKREKLYRKDFLQADDHYQNLVNRFLREFRGEIKL